MTATLTTRGPAPLAGLSDADRARVGAMIQDGINPHTARAYAGAWARFAAWCDGRGAPALPADPAHVAAYLAARDAAGRAPATLRLDAAGIAHHHQAASLPNPCATRGVRATLKGRPLRQQRQAAGLTRRDVDKIERHAYTRRRGESQAAAETRGAMDAAIVRTMHDALLRAAEAAGLTWGALAVAPDGADGGGSLMVARAKGGESRAHYVGPETVAALLDIRPADVDPAAPIFTGRGGRGLSPDALRQRFKRACRAAGFTVDATGAAYSSHAARVGMARAMVARGATLPELQQSGAWKDARMPARYAARELAARDAVARRIYGVRG